MLVKKYLLVALVAPIALLTVSPAKADDKVTDFGDGMKMTEYGDASGFKITGGGAEFTYNYKTKEMTVIQGQEKSSVKWDGAQL